MIAFACPQCGHKLQVQDHFAGRSAKCPSCKQPLTVPAANQFDATVGGQIPTRVVGAISLDQTGLTDGAGRKPLQDLLARRTNPGERYVVESEIARGGMGAVWRAVDCDIRREVAVKYLLDQADDRKKLRFVEEAQITGQLEHPNIVPIHELGIDAKQRLFFSMKMVKGRSVAEVLDELRQNARAAEKEWPLGRLLNVFVNVCHALAYAHARNVIHRDLKPANIMVGDFGEVYVMDWGLAKVLHGGGQKAAETLSLPPEGQPDIRARAGRVLTDREPEANLTQDGAVLGTPVYMPPEQASGQIQVIDQRSDVYSLGAILYEMLTLEPPVERAGGTMSALMQVLQGQIVAPEQRTPQRARAGKVPRELSAVAMKALAKEQADRYPDVEALRRDVERFQEGRSVSAKEDTKREMVVKFVRRNKGFSAGVAAALLVLLASVVVLFSAWQDTRQAQSETASAYADVLAEKRKTEERTRSAVPALVDSARLLANEGKVNEAQRQIELAIDYEKANPDAHLLKGQLLVGQKNWDAGRAQLEQYLKLRPGDQDAKKLLDLCGKGRKDDIAFLVEIAEVFQRQQLYGVAARLLKDVARSVVFD